MSDPYIRDSAAFEALCEQARHDGRFALDTEFHRERRYYPELALLQMAVGERCVLVDPLGSVELAPLGELLSDGNVVKVLHAPAQDLEIFYLRFGAAPRNVFDTQIAAALLGMGAQVSLGGLIERTVDVRLAKGASFTDWLRRPLSERQESYALDDVRYLLAAHDRLLERLRELGREAWLREECEVFEDASLYEPDLETIYTKVKRFKSLDPRGRAVLSELARWREESARDRNRNRRAIAGDEVLIELARSKPSNPKALARTRGLPEKAVAREGDEILRAIEAGAVKSTEPFVDEGPPARLGEEAELAGTLLQAFLKVYCRELSIDSSVIATSAQIQRLVVRHLEGRLEPGSVPVLRGWRGELVGQKLLAFLRGEIAVRLDPDSGAPRFEAAG